MGFKFSIIHVDVICDAEHNGKDYETNMYKTAFIKIAMQLSAGNV